VYNTISRSPLESYPIESEGEYTPNFTNNKATHRTFSTSERLGYDPKASKRIEGLALLPEYAKKKEAAQLLLSQPLFDYIAARIIA
jgi:hypothetical protein